MPKRVTILPQDWGIFAHQTSNGWRAGESYDRCTGESDELWNDRDGAEAKLQERLGRRLTPGEQTLLSLSIMDGPLPALTGAYSHTRTIRDWRNLTRWVLNKEQTAEVLRQWLQH
jgi:hypothetical protein